MCAKDEEKKNRKGRLYSDIGEHLRTESGLYGGPTVRQNIKM